MGKKMRGVNGVDPEFTEIKDGPIAKGTGCPEVGLDKFPQALTSSYCKKEELKDGYERAFNVYTLAFDGLNCTVKGNKNPWEITTTLKDKDHTYTIQTRIVRLEGKDVYAFDFKRIAGPPLDYAKIWKNMESTLLAADEKGKNPFWDNIECKDIDETDDEEEAKEAEDEAPKKADKDLLLKNDK